MSAYDLLHLNILALHINSKVMCHAQHHNQPHCRWLVLHQFHTCFVYIIKATLSTRLGMVNICHAIQWRLQYPLFGWIRSSLFMASTDK